MATLPNMEELWTVREYLRTSWSPDREFVDGRIEERNWGEKEHSIIQQFLTVLFAIHRAEWGVWIGRKESKNKEIRSSQHSFRG